MQMLLGQTGGITGPSKNDIDEGVPASPWANLLSVGLRVLTALLGGPQQSVDGIDKVDNQSSPMQVFDKVINVVQKTSTIFDMYNKYRKKSSEDKYSSICTYKKELVDNSSTYLSLYNFTR